MRFLLLTVVLVGLLPSALFAQSSSSRVQTAMERQFGAMVNTTNPQAAMGARRGVLTGGSLSIRNSAAQSGNINLISTEPLSFSTGDGCGGIDLFAGSFSAISGDQLKNVGRQIASQAATYAFHLALSAVCKECENTMSDINATLQKFNMQLQDTCSIAKGIVQLAPGDQDGDAQREELKQGFQRLGSGARDAWSAMGRNSATSDTASSRNYAENPEGAKKLTPGNVIWRAMKTVGVQTWITGGSGSDEALMEEIMSLTGSVIVCHADDPDCQEVDAEQPTFRTRSIDPTLSFETFLLGGNETGQGTFASPEAVSAQIWRCGSDRTSCLHPTKSEFTLKGFAAVIQEAYLGTSEGQGLIDRIRTGNPGLTSFDSQLIGSASQTEVAGYVLQLVRECGDVAAARQFVRENAKQLGAEHAYELLRQLLLNARSAVMVTSADATSEKVLEMIRFALQDLERGYGRHRADTQSMVLMGQRLAMLKGACPPPRFEAQMTQAPAPSGS